MSGWKTATRGQPFAKSAAGDAETRDLANDDLRAAHATFRHLVENSPFGIYVVDADFRLVLVSAGAQKVFANVRPLIGRDFAQVLRCVWEEPFASEAIRLFRNTLETGDPYHAPNTIERRHDIAQVESYDWKIERLTLPDGRLGVVCHFYDMSERQRLEAALLESEARFRGTFENSAVGVAHVGLDGAFREVNQRLCDILGYSREALLARTFQDITYRDDLQADLDNGNKVLNGDLASYSMDKRYIRMNGDVVWCGLTVSLQRDLAGAPQYFISVVRDIAARIEAQDHVNFLMRELAHRSKNQLAIIQAMANQTARNARSLDEFRRHFAERIQGLSVATDLLVAQKWVAAPLDLLIRRQLETFAADDTLSIDEGPKLSVSADAAQAIGLALHELATNSVKYGAWSIPGGAVTISWTLVRDGANPTQLRVGWIERGGPVVTPPTRKGFGRMVIERMVAQKLDGAVEIEFAPQGLSWTLSLPAAHFEEALRQATPTSGNAMT